MLNKPFEKKSAIKNHQSHNSIGPEIYKGIHLSYLLSIIIILVHQRLNIGVCKSVVIPQVAGCL